MPKARPHPAHEELDLLAADLIEFFTPAETH